MTLSIFMASKPLDQIGSPLPSTLSPSFLQRIDLKAMIAVRRFETQGPA